MFEYEGSLYSLDDIQAIVDDYNTKNDASYTVDDYVSMAGMVKVDDSAKTEGVDQQDVTTESPVKPSEGLMQDMASFSENYSSGSNTEDNQNQMGEFKLYTPDTSQPVDQTTVFTPVITDHNELKEFAEEIQNNANQSKLAFTRIDPEESIPINLFCDTKPSHSVQPEDTLILDLNLSEKELLAQMKRKGRYNISLSETEASVTLTV